MDIALFLAQCALCASLWVWIEVFACYIWTGQVVTRK